MTERNPMQPLVQDAAGRIRFKENAIVRAFYDAAAGGRKLDLNDIARMDFTQEDRCQFAQLIGYSLSGYHELSYVSDEHAQDASEAAKRKFPELQDVGGCRDAGCSIHNGVAREA